MGCLFYSVIIDFQCIEIFNDNYHHKISEIQQESFYHLNWTHCHLVETETKMKKQIFTRQNH